MTKLNITLLGLSLIVACATLTWNPALAQLSSVDALWSEVSRTVGEGDFEGYAATYHPDAVLVNGLSQTSYPISSALAGWKAGFEDTKSQKQTAGVEFRFSQRLADDSTAHDTGIFHYWYQPEGSARVDSYIHFEGLLVNKDGWKMVMEYQKSVASIEDWNAIRSEVP